MKKIFTLLFATAMMASAFAQYGPKDQKDYSYGNDNGRGSRFDNGKSWKNKDDYQFNDNAYFAAREKEMQIAQINSPLATAGK